MDASAARSAEVGCDSSAPHSRLLEHSSCSGPNEALAWEVVLEISEAQCRYFISAIPTASKAFEIRSMVELFASVMRLSCDPADRVSMLSICKLASNRFLILEKPPAFLSSS